MASDKAPRVAPAEADLLRFVSERGQVTVREIEVDYGRPRSLSRGTIVKAVFRLHQKGLLVRKKAGPVFRYSTRLDPDALDVKAVREFLHSRLQGRIEPIMNFLTDAREVRKEELKKIRDAINEVLEE